RRGLSTVEAFIHDLRYALRSLKRAPTFTATVVVVLALGIGANTTVFSLVDAVLLKHLPVREPDRLSQLIRAGFDHDSDDFSYPIFRNMAERARPFADLVADADIGGDKAVIDGTIEERVYHDVVSANYFSVLGVGPAIGRIFSSEDDREPGKHPVAVISYGFWKRYFNLDR